MRFLFIVLAISMTSPAHANQFLDRLSKSAANWDELITKEPTGFEERVFAGATPSECIETYDKVRLLETAFESEFNSKGAEAKGTFKAELTPDGELRHSFVGRVLLKGNDMQVKMNMRCVGGFGEMHTLIKNTKDKK